MVGKTSLSTGEASDSEKTGGKDNRARRLEKEEEEKILLYHLKAVLRKEKKTRERKSRSTWCMPNLSSLRDKAEKKRQKTPTHAWTGSSVCGGCTYTPRYIHIDIYIYIYQEGGWSRRSRRRNLTKEKEEKMRRIAEKVDGEEEEEELVYDGDGSESTIQERREGKK